MKLDEFLGFWVNTFLKPDKKIKEPTFKEGVISTAFASVIFGVFLFFIGLLSTSENVGNAFLMNVIGLPILAVIGLLVFSLIIRVVSSLFDGKGKFKKDCAVVGLYLGSFILVGGIILAIVSSIVGYVLEAMAVETFSFIVSFAGIGLMLGFAAFFSLHIYSVLVGHLSTYEKMSDKKMSIVLALSTGIMLFICCAALGILLDITMGEYMRYLQAMQGGDYGGYGGFG